MIFDGHSHFISIGMIENLRKRVVRLNPALAGRQIKSKIHSKPFFDYLTGTNNWREFLPSVMSLKMIFKRAIKVYGTERVIFGTDSVVSSDGYRHSIKDEQIKILDSLKLKSSEIDKVLGSNILGLLPNQP